MDAVRVQITAQSGKSCVNGYAVLNVWSSLRAGRLGLRWCLLIWAVGSVTLFLPLVHFLTVPASLVGGPLVGFLIYRFYRGSSDIADVEIACPACQSPLSIEDKTVDWPLILRCENCSAELSIKPSSAEA